MGGQDLARDCVAESLLGVIVGEMGVGKTVALRAATAGLDPAAHQVIHVPTPPSAPVACM